MLEDKVIDNFTNVKLWVMIPFFLILFLIYLYIVLYNDGASYVDTYIEIQKDLFFYLNHELSWFPNFQYNLTQLGDVIIFFPLLTIFIIYAPKLWEVLLTSAILSLVVSVLLKELFTVPRPAVRFNNDSFIIVGETHRGLASLPSGHCITTFVGMTVLLFAFMPKKNTHKIIWSFAVIALGLTIGFARVGVGAHYPLDVIIGSIIGFIVSILGIKISNKINLFGWIKNKKYHPIYILVLTVWGLFIVKKIMNLNLLIFYISLCSLVITIYLMTRNYVKKNH